MRQLPLWAILALLAGCIRQPPPLVQSPPATPQPASSELRSDLVFQNPVDQKTYVSPGGWKVVSPSNPAPSDPGEPVKLRLVRLLTAEDDLAERVTIDELAVFTKEAIRLGKEIFGKSDKHFQVTAQFNCQPDEFKVRMSYAGDAPDELLQNYYEAAVALNKLAVKRDEVAFQLNFEVNMTAEESAAAAEAAAAAQASPERPAAPPGFRWHELAEIQGAALVPDGWHFRATEKAGTITYQITKEETDDVKQFDTGLTINVVRDVKAKTKLSPLEHAFRYIGTSSKGAETVVAPDLSEVGPFQRVFCEIRRQYPETGEKKFRIRIEALANQSNGTLYVMLFGAPDDEWETAWLTGKQLLGQLVLQP